VKEFLHLHSGKVDPSWIDRNGHMNVVHYMRLFDEGMDLMLKATGMTNWQTKNGHLTIVASRINIVHRKELLCGEPWALSSAFSTITTRYISLVLRLTANYSIRAYCYILGVFFCIDRRRPAILAENLLDNLKPFRIAELTDPFKTVFFEDNE